MLCSRGLRLRTHTIKAALSAHDLRNLAIPISELRATPASYFQVQQVTKALALLCGMDVLIATTILVHTDHDELVTLTHGEADAHKGRSVRGFCLTATFRSTTHNMQDATWPCSPP